MKTSRLLLFIPAILLICSCQKEVSVETGTDPVLPAANIKDSLTVKSIKQTQYDQNGEPYTWIDNYRLDTVLNKIKQIETSSYYGPNDSTVSVFSYNNKNQIISIEKNGQPAIEFTRDAAGKLLTSTTHYQNAIVNESTGTFTFGIQGTGFTVTYLDSTLKFPGNNPGDARSFYKYTFSPDSTVTAYEEFYISTDGEYKKDIFNYDNNKNLIAVTTVDSIGNTLYTISYLRDAVKHTSLTSFFKRLGGDLFWFYQSKQLSILPYIFNEYDSKFALSAPKKITYTDKISGSSFSSFNNTYDSKGNLITTEESDDSGRIISKTEITYNP